MNTKLAFSSAIAVVLCLALCGGCVATGTVKNEQRDTVRFASPVAAQIFYEAYIAKNYTHPMASGTYVALEVPVQAPYQHREYPTDNVYFNAAVSAADTNHDGVISDDEAQRYSDSVHPLPKGSLAVAKQ